MTPLIGWVSGQVVRPDGATARPGAVGGVRSGGERRGTVGSDGRVGRDGRTSPGVGVVRSDGPGVPRAPAASSRAGAIWVSARGRPGRGARGGCRRGRGASPTRG